MALPPEVRDFLEEAKIEAKTRLMMIEEEYRALQRWQDVRERVDVWLTSLAGAILAYAIQSYDSGIIRSFQWLAPVSWTLLLLAVVYGIRGLQVQALTHLGHLMEVSAERLKQANIMQMAQLQLFSRLHIDIPDEIKKDQEKSIEDADEEITGLLLISHRISQQLGRKGEETYTRRMEKTRKLAFMRSVLLVGGLIVLAVLRLLNMNV